jgi:hypothetical protein
MQNVYDPWNDLNAYYLIRPTELDQIVEAVTRRLNPKESADQILVPDIEAPISQLEASRFIGKSRQTLIKLRKRGIITAYKLGGRIYYKKSELVAAMEIL